MADGFKRTAWQVLPESLAKITCVLYNDDGQATAEWFERSLQSWHGDSLEGQAFSFSEWDFVLVVPLKSAQLYWCGNDGMTAWRNKRSGDVVPDHCRQTGGCPEVWNGASIKGRREVQISNLTEVEPYVILDHSQTTSPAFPETFGPRSQRTFFRR